MKQLNRVVGTNGERIAADFLQKKGFRILERNYSTKFGEIDLIATKDKILVFVEVKLKQGDDFGTPEEMIDSSKLSQVIRMAEFYLVDNSKMAKKHESYRIDAVCIVANFDGGIERINHYENIGF